MSDDVSGQFLQFGGADLDLEDDNARFRAAQAQDDSEGFYENVKKSMAGAVGLEGVDRTKGAGRALDFLLDAPKNIGVGAYRALVNTIDTAWDFEAAAIESMTKVPGAPTDKQGGVKVPSLTEAFPDLMKNVYGLADQWSAGNQIEDDIAEGIAQFTIPFTGWLKAFGGVSTATKAATVAKAAAAEAVTAGSAFDPHEGRFADLLQMGRQLDNRFGDVLRKLSPDGSLVARYIDYMTARENEGEWHGRFKNAVDSLVTTATIAGLVKTAGTALKTARQGKLFTTNFDTAAATSFADIDGNPVPKAFRESAKDMEWRSSNDKMADATGLWFLDGDKPVFTWNAGKDPEKILGPRAADLSQYDSITRTFAAGSGDDLRVWFKPGEKARAEELADLMTQPIPKMETLDDVLKQARRHAKIGQLLGYPEPSTWKFANEWAKKHVRVEEPKPKQKEAKSGA